MSKIIGQDFSNKSFPSYEGKGLTYENCTFHSTRMTDSNFGMAVFNNCTFKNTDFTDSDFRDVRFENCQLESTSFLGAYMDDVCLRVCEIAKCNFNEAFMDDAYFDLSVVHKCDFIGTNLRSTQFSGGSVNRSDFSFANLYDIYGIQSTSISNCDFDRAFDDDYGYRSWKVPRYEVNQQRKREEVRQDRQMLEAMEREIREAEEANAYVIQNANAYIFIGLVMFVLAYLMTPAEEFYEILFLIVFIGIGLVSLLLGIWGKSQ